MKLYVSHSLFGNTISVCFSRKISVLKIIVCSLTCSNMGAKAKKALKKKLSKALVSSHKKEAADFLVYLLWHFGLSLLLNF